MSDSAKRFMEIYAWTIVSLFFIRCLIGFSGLISSFYQHDYLNISYSILGYAGEAIGITAAFMSIFNKWLWKKKQFYYLAGDLPVLAKHYVGKITFVWKDVNQTRDSEIWINQTFLNVSVKLGTSESTSNVITASIQKVNNERQLIYIYLNTPRAELQDKSAIHYGTAMLCVDDPPKITGNYFTSRSTKGSMMFHAVDN